MVKMENAKKVNDSQKILYIRFWSILIYCTFHFKNHRHFTDKVTSDRTLLCEEGIKKY